MENKSNDLKQALSQQHPLYGFSAINHLCHFYQNISHTPNEILTLDEVNRIIALPHREFRSGKLNFRGKSSVIFKNKFE